MSESWILIFLLFIVLWIIGLIWFCLCLNRGGGHGHRDPADPPERTVRFHVERTRVPSDPNAAIMDVVERMLKVFN